MSEQEKQEKTAKQKQHEAELARGEHPEENIKNHPKNQRVGMASDPEAMKDPDYIKTIEEKTNKH